MDKKLPYAPLLSSGDYGSICELRRISHPHLQSIFHIQQEVLGREGYEGIKKVKGKDSFQTPHCDLFVSLNTCQEIRTTRPIIKPKERTFRTKRRMTLSGRFHVNKGSTHTLEAVQPKTVQQLLGWGCYEQQILTGFKGLGNSGTHLKNVDQSRGSQLLECCKCSQSDCQTECLERRCWVCHLCESQQLGRG